LLLLLAVRRGPRAVLFREGEDQLGAVTNRGSAASNKIGRTRSINYPMSTVVIPIRPFFTSNLALVCLALWSGKRCECAGNDMTNYNNGVYETLQRE
jgi:hypothetical protein